MRSANPYNIINEPRSVEAVKMASLSLFSAELVTDSVQDEDEPKTRLPERKDRFYDDVVFLEDLVTSIVLFRELCPVRYALFYRQCEDCMSCIVGRHREHFYDRGITRDSSPVEIAEAYLPAASKVVQIEPSTSLGKTRVQDEVWITQHSKRDEPLVVPVAAMLFFRLLGEENMNFGVDLVDDFVYKSGLNRNLVMTYYGLMTVMSLYRGGYRSPYNMDWLYEGYLGSGCLPDGCAYDHRAFERIMQIDFDAGVAIEEELGVPPETPRYMRNTASAIFLRAKEILVRDELISETPSDLLSLIAERLGCEVASLDVVCDLWHEQSLVPEEVTDFGRFVELVSLSVKLDDLARILPSSIRLPTEIDLLEMRGIDELEDWIRMEIFRHLVDSMVVFDWTKQQWRVDRKEQRPVSQLRCDAPGEVFGLDPDVVNRVIGLARGLNDESPGQEDYFAEIYDNARAEFLLRSNLVMERIEAPSYPYRDYATALDFAAFAYSHRVGDIRRFPRSAGDMRDVFMVDLHALEGIAEMWGNGATPAGFLRDVAIKASDTFQSAYKFYFVLKRRKEKNSKYRALVRKMASVFVGLRSQSELTREKYFDLFPPIPVWEEGVIRLSKERGDLECHLTRYHKVGIERFLDDVRSEVSCRA